MQWLKIDDVNFITAEKFSQLMLGGKALSRSNWDLQMPGYFYDGLDVAMRDRFFEPGGPIGFESLTDPDGI